MTGTSAHGDAGTQLAWQRAFDRLEQDLLQAERLAASAAASAADPWMAPDLPGPMPAALVGRAREIQRRQRVVLDRLHTAMAMTARERDLLHRLDSGVRAALPPVYVDTRA